MAARASARDLFRKEQGVLRPPVQKCEEFNLQRALQYSVTQKQLVDHYNNTLWVEGDYDGDYAKWKTDSEARTVQPGAQAVSCSPQYKDALSKQTRSPPESTRTNAFHKHFSDG